MKRRKTYVSELFFGNFTCSPYLERISSGCAWARIWPLNFPIRAVMEVMACIDIGRLLYSLPTGIAGLKVVLLRGGPGADRADAFRSDGGRHAPLRRKRSRGFGFRFGLG